MENANALALLGICMLLLAGCTTQYVCPDGETVANPEDCFAEEEAEVEPEEIVQVGGNCGTDFECFIAAAETCTEANLTRTASINLFGIITTATNVMEIRGMEGGKCVYYQKTIKNEVTFSEEFLEQAREGGATEGELKEQLAASNEMAQATVGFEVTCEFSTQELTAMLENWKAGVGSSSDLAACEQKMPEPAIPEEPAEEVVCVPAAGEGSYVELGIYKTYEIIEGGGIMYGNALVGDSLESAYGHTFTIEEIVINGGTCESCDSKPENAGAATARITATGLLESGEPTEYYAEAGDTIFFCSSWNSTKEECEEHVRLHIFDVHAELVCVEEE